MNQFRQINPVPQETRDEVERIHEEWKENQIKNDAAMADYEEEDDEYEAENESEEKSYCPACGFPNCSGYCL